MVKSKNHTEWINKPRKQRHTTTDGMDPEFLRNGRYSRKQNQNNGESATEEE